MLQVRICVCVVSWYVCGINDTCALGSRQNLLFYETGTKKDGAHTCFELRRSEAQIFFRYFLEARHTFFDNTCFIPSQ